ncbi:probable inactive peptidyl-prolyl cis-trans isomerase-like 6 isoform X1 [Dunckerocampus dactyliophorus]|uniref:probable inactive peptidyl-prolyl cis-trans isomerase-like 6 isoform X1 n=1 Tax=Dunckerocampus dactyliophorus TaxID=161453 RepID=UPI00240775E6|nr:probable inactive peptidyl-prolyl cis-trans isomerase-like 6 isoform X1 [Dunckerocampus dactyliophorus]
MAGSSPNSMDPKPHIEIVGLIKEPHFHVAKSITEGLIQKFPREFTEPTIRPLLEFDWHAYLSNQKREMRGEVWEFSSGVMCFLDGHFIGDEGALATWAENQWGFTCIEPQASCVGEHYLKHLQSTGHRFVFMDIEIGGEAVGRLLFELFSDVCPKTSWNFEALCTGERGLSPNGHPLCYKGSLFHRVVPNGWVQGGDISPERRGNGGESIYGPTFEDESFAVSHTKRGTLGMANKGPHSNGSQFYITLQATFWMDRTYVPFGQVVEGVDVLKRIEETPTINQRPKHECTVVNCGVFKV